MARRLFTCAAVAAALAFAAGVAGIWIEDHRWGDTAGAFGVVAFTLVFAGLLTGIWES